MRAFFSSITLHILKDVEELEEELVSCNLHSSVCFQIKKLIYFLLEFSAPFTVRTITKMELLSLHTASFFCETTFDLPFFLLTRPLVKFSGARIKE